VFSLVNMALPAFAAERRAAARLLPPLSVDILACTVIIGKRAARRCCGRMTGRTDTVPFHKSCSAYSAGSGGVVVNFDLGGTVSET